MDWLRSGGLFPVYRVSELVCPSDKNLEVDRIISSPEEFENMGTYLTDALFLFGLGEVVILQSHEDYVALGKRKRVSQSSRLQ
jgi:hypothetical protein